MGLGWMGYLLGPTFRAPYGANNYNADKNKSVLKLHSNNHHNGADVRYSMRVTGLHNDSLDRQVTEGVNISNFRGDVLMNRRDRCHISEVLKL